MSESSVVRRILKALNALPRCRAVKTHGSVYGRRGTPDLDIVYHGQAYKLEAKRPGQEPTPLQRYEMRLWAEAGAITGVVTSPAEALAMLEED